METTDFGEIGANIRKQRQNADMTQEDLASRVGVTSQYISQVERAEKNVSLNVLIQIANVLNIDINLLLGRNVIVKNIHLDEKMAALMADATPNQKRLCLTLCEAVVKYPDNLLCENRRRGQACAVSFVGNPGQIVFGEFR